MTEPAERPTMVLVMFEWSIEHPLWDPSPGGHGLVDPEALGVSPNLAQPLRAWNDEHNDAPDGPENFSVRIQHSPSRRSSGIVAKERSDAEQGAVLRRLSDENVLSTFAERVLPFDISAARSLAAHRVPEHAPFDDALIGAVAESAEMTVVTRNSKHFETLGVPASIRGTQPRPETEPQRALNVGGGVEL